MKTQLFTIYDEKAEAFLPPFTCGSEGIAKRAFADCVNSQTHQFGKHPQDYTLFWVGDFYDHDGSIVVASRKSLGNGVEFIAPDLADTPEELTRDQSNASVQQHQTRGNSA